MKWLMILIGLFWFGQPILLFGQELIKVENYDRDWNKLNSDRSYYQRKIYKVNDSLYAIKDFIKNKYLEMEGYAKSIDPVIEDGEFKFFDKKGKVLHSYSYRNGELISCNHTYDGTLKHLDYDFKIEYDSTEIIDFNKVNPITSKEDSLNIIEKMPSFEGGDINKYRMMYFAKNLHYPYPAIRYKKTGRIYVSFIIDETGKVTDIKIVKPQYKDLNKEAIRVIRNSPNWTPGYRNGKPVKVKFTFPVIFVLA